MRVARGGGSGMLVWVKLILQSRIYWLIISITSTRTRVVIVSFPKRLKGRNMFLPHASSCNVEVGMAMGGDTAPIFEGWLWACYCIRLNLHYLCNGFIFYLWKVTLVFKKNITNLLTQMAMCTWPAQPLFPLFASTLSSFLCLLHASTFWNQWVLW